MSLYRFKVSNRGGAVSELLIEGDSQTDATRRVRARGLLPLECLGEGSEAASRRTGFRLRPRFDTVDFTDRLVPLLEAGIPLERALGIVGEGVENKFAARLIGDLRRGLHEGRKFSELIRDRGRLFPPLYANVVEAGEEAGALPQVMGELRRFLNDSRELRSFLITSSIYPAVVLTVSLSVLLILLWVVVPRFAGVLQTAGGELPLSTQLLLGFSAGTRRFWWLVPAAAAGLALLVNRMRRGGRVRAAADGLFLRLPVSRSMVLFANLGRLARTTAILMRSGVHLLDTVSIAIRVVQNETLRRSLAGVAGELRQGQRLSQALSHSRFVPSFMLRLLAVGEETGAVDVMFDRVAERYEQDLKRLIRRALSLFEPAVIVCLGVFVAFVVLAMFVAIVEMQSQF